jgi:hydroxymethylbilane synthase
VVTTEGDRVQAGTLPSWGRGVFAHDIEAALLRGEIDLAIHSLKDLPADLPAGLAIVAVPQRGPAGDVLVSRDGRSLDDLRAGARVGTSSLRRTAFLRAVRPDLIYLPVRGNVGTRWRKLLDPAQGYDALVLAAAGLERLGLAEVPRAAIPTDVLLPAPGQGALALEARAGDTRVAALAALLNHAPSAAAVRAERRLLSDLEGGCRLPVAGLAQAGDKGSLSFTAAVAAPDGTRVLWRSGDGRADEPEALGAQVAADLLAAGARDLLQQATAAEVPV